MVALGRITNAELEIVVKEPVKPGKLLFSGTSTELGSTISTALGASVELLGRVLEVERAVEFWEGVATGAIDVGAVVCEDVEFETGEEVSINGLITLSEVVDEEDTGGVEVEELIGSSPPLMGVSPPVELGLIEDVETGRAVGMEVKDVDPGAAVLLVTEEEVLDDVGPVTTTVVVVEEVRPPPGVSVVPPSPTDAIGAADAWLALAAGGSTPKLEVVTAIAKASTA